MGVRTPEILSSPEPGAAAGLLLSQFPLRPITNKALEGKENPKTIGFKRKSPKRRLWRMKRGGFEEVSRFSRHNVAGNRLTRWCVLLPTFPAAGKSGPSETRSLCKALLLTKSMPPAGKQKTAIERTHLTGGKKSTGTSARSIRVRHQPPRRFGTADA